MKDSIHRTSRWGSGAGALFAAPSRPPREVLRLHNIIASSGGIEWAQQAAVAFAEAATHEFESTAFAGVPAGPDLDWLRSCINYLVQRDA